MNRTQFLISASLLACTTFVEPVIAQQAPAAASAADQASKDDQTLQEVVVTAERRVNTAQKTAAAISVRAGDDMQSQGRYELKNILEDVPGVDGGAATTVNTSQGSGTDNPASGLVIRGVQSNGGAGGSVTSTAPAAAIYVDDVYSGIGGGYDIDRVEVLRGPQGTLYGRSATSGVVAIRTGEPDTARFGAQGAAEFGNYSLTHISGYVNVPIVNDKLALRVSGNLFDRDGYYSADGGALKNKDFRVKGLWNATDTFSVLVGYAQENNETHSGGVSISQSTPGNFVFVPQSVSPTSKNDSQQYWANFKLDLGPVELTYIPAYRVWNQDATLYLRSLFLNADQTVTTRDDSFMTHELRVRGKDSDSKFQWQGGYLHYDNKLDDSNVLFIIPSGPYAFQTRSHKTTTADGVFVEGIYSFSSETRLTAGTRYDHTKIVNNQDYTSILGITQSLTGDAGLRTFDNVTYRLRLEHDLTPQNLLYGSISTGFSPGDVTLTTDATFKPVVQVLEDQTLTAYEIGSKNRFLDNRLQVNGTVFYYDYGGYQTAGINTSPQTPGTPTFNTISSPMTSYGAELEVDSRPTPNGRLMFTAAYVHARYGGFGQYDYLFSKSEVPGVAPLQATLAYDHRFPLGSATLLMRGALRYASAHDTSSINDASAAVGAGPWVHVGAQTLGDFNVTLMLEPHYSITAYVRNIFDSQFIPDGWGIAGAVPGPPGSGPIVAEGGFALNDPRTYGMMVTFKF
jgi:iron complex outermembrane receptor protein